LPDPSQQRQAFDAFWLSRLGEADAQNPAERISRYYRSIYAADTLFAEPNQDGWTTHRGTCFLQMGMPQRILYQEAGGDSLQFWHYPHFSLWVGFQRDAQGRWLRLPQS
jgi:GWxTD domain-containing protein